MGIFFALAVKRDLPDLPKLQVRRNPDFIKDENAFLKLYNKIMKKSA
jgi:hypothetical protein